MKTRITDLFGIDTPVVAGGLQWLANADYVSAAARAGIIGFLTAASFEDLEELRDEVQKCRDLSERKPFGVNVSMLPKLVEGDRTEQVFQLIVDEGVRFVETSGRNPEPYLPALHEVGIKVIHKVPAVRFAKKAEAAGVDAISLVGAECGGHPGLDMIGSIVLATLAARELSVPFIIGGGIGTGEQLAAALALGADGVIIGTRFLVADEIWAHRHYKQRLLDAAENDTTLVLQSLRNTLRALNNDTTEEVRRIESETPGNLDLLMPHISGHVGKQAYETGDWSKGALSVGQAVAFADRMEPLSDIVKRITREAEMALTRTRNIAES